MSPPKPEAGANVRLFLRSRRTLDGVIEGYPAEGWAAVTRRRDGRLQVVPWEEVFSYHRLDARGHRLPVEPELPLEGTR